MLKDLLEQRISVNWFLPDKVEQEKVDYIFECLRLCPSKQNRYPYKIYALPNSEKFKQWMVNEMTWCRGEPRKLLGAKAEPNEPKRMNLQYSAPLVLIWAKPIKHQFDEPNQRDIEIGISSSIAMMAALEQGLGTSFGKCHVVDKITKAMGLKDHVIDTILGIGYQEDTTQRQLDAEYNYMNATRGWVKQPSNYLTQALAWDDFDKVCGANTPPERKDFYPRNIKDVSKLITVVDHPLPIEFKL